MSAIIVKDLGKAYKQYPNRWSRLLEWLSPFNKPHHTLKWVIHNINFIVQPGEAVGVIGINGAGKSTLLKMITGTTQPTTGSVTMSGRVAALLELGMGFHPDFTGRQNAFMAGQLLGLSVNEIIILMPEIEAFAEIGDYIDQPVRVYSSGMQVRLAFSVATAIRPDILIIDEALSVGDAYFQHKSFERIREFRRKGTTLLLVSHDQSAIQGICDRALLLNNGVLELESSPEAVMDLYNALMAKGRKDSIQLICEKNSLIGINSGNGKASILSCMLQDEFGCAVELIEVGKRVGLKILIKANDHLPFLVVGFVIKDRLGQPIFGTNTHYLKDLSFKLVAAEKKEIVFNFLANIGEGDYSIAIALHDGESHIDENYEWKNRAILFTVVNRNKPKFVGNNWLAPELEVL